MSDDLRKSIEWRFEENLIEYEDAVNFMEQKVLEIASQKSSNLIWVLEHYPVYTAGISAKDEDLLNRDQTPIFKSNRGGKYTYHCPGMKIIYVMLDLKQLFYPSSPDITQFVKFLENWIIAVLKHYQIHGEIKAGRVGIWVETPQGEKKISAIGIKLKKWVAYHGIAINITPNLQGFNNIVPCGLKDYGVTSFEDLGIKNFNEQEFYKILKEEFYKNLEAIKEIES